ncbi:MAG: hypothetical protein Q9220_006493 [cf. Caloplaca sp. 1 TL-2023]
MAARLQGSKPAEGDATPTTQIMSAHEIQSVLPHELHKNIYQDQVKGAVKTCEELAMLYECRGNYFQAERLFEKAVCLEAQKHISNLTRLYGLFKERIKSMVFEYDDMNRAAAESILDRAARIDVDELSISLYQTKSIPPAQSDSHEVLFSAAAYNACNLARLSLSRGADVEGGGQLYGESPLHSAIDYGSMDMVNLLITEGADIESKDLTGETPLHRAAAKNSIEILAYLLLRNANTDARRKDQATVLMMACTQGPEVVRCLLEKGALANLQDQRGWTALHWATNSKKVDIIQILLRYHAVIDARSKDRKTALIQAAATPNTSLETVEFLLENGASVDFSDLSGRAAIHWAVSHRDQGLLDLLLDFDANINAMTDDLETPLVRAARKNDLKIMRRLLERGAPVNSVDSEERSAVHWAAEHENTDMLKTLIEFHAEIEIADDRGLTALHIVASRYPYSTAAFEFVDILIDGGLSVHLPDKPLERILDKAAQCGDKLNVGCFISRLASVAINDKVAFALSLRIHIS